MKEAAVAIFGTVFVGITLFVAAFGLEAIWVEFGLFVMAVCILMWVLSLVGVCRCMDD